MRSWAAMSVLILFLTACVSTSKPSSLHSQMTDTGVSSTQTTNTTPSSVDHSNSMALDLGSSDPNQSAFYSNSASVHSTQDDTPSTNKLDVLWKSLLRYAKNVSYTAQMYQANLSDADEALIDKLISLHSQSRTQKQQAILFVALMEHAVVEYEYQREAQATQSSDVALSKQPAKPPDHTTNSSTKKEFKSSQDSPQESQLKPEEVLNFLATEYSINIIKELTSNPYLMDPEIYHLSLHVMHYVQAPQELQSALMAHIKTPAKAWAALYDSVLNLSESDPLTNLSTPADSSHESITKAIDDLNQQNASRRYSVGEFSEGDRIMAEAKQLHGQKQYRQALDLIAEIKPSSPHYNAAQNLSHRFADDAVNQLRGEAAKLYQAQLKILSIQTKIEYLTKSEKKLLTALREYPESKWISKVRNNLAVIQQKLEDLSKVSESSPSS